MQRVTAELYPGKVVGDIVNNANLMEQIVQEVQEEMELEQQEDQEDEEEEEEEEEEEGGASDDMIQQYFKLLTEKF
jgi:hypothetical protein